ncbi:transglycosylase SLT domain-containing protein [Mariprofundus ferrooxydans]|uniref:transglycosylase SLT domain-containing protein n=1 Tax=Mariprofundus ferrooxydans TaxID=314344 RepID=UPI0003606344|nr:transglycosylase SLT domain-containing protein [Mariprofundus ferrooxydans]
MGAARVTFLLLALMVSACASGPPKHLNDGCAIFREKDDWYEYANDSFKRWGVPVHVQLAIIHQESRFRRKAKAPEDTLLGFIPWGRVSSAYGYAQVLDSTWETYKRATGNSGADRDDFEDITDFIGWYGNTSYRRLGISKWDAYNQYLAYHEGQGGWKRKTYKRKPWLIKVARKVERRAAMYRAQLARCKDDLDSGWSLWPF